MRKLLLLGSAVCFAGVAVAGVKAAVAAPTSIVGTWTGKDDTGQIGAFVFGADGSADLIKGNVSLKDTVKHGRGAVTYHYDRTATPIALDIILEVKDRPTTTIRCIAEFLSQNKMRVRMPSGDARPTDFSGPKDEILVVHRAGTEE